MPIYEYECKACGFRHEAIQKMSDDPLVDCPSCHKPELKKLISAAAFRLKGGGWYETDFKSGKKKNLVHADGKEAKKSTDKPADKKTTTGEKSTVANKGHTKTATAKTTK
ncbi:MAG: zinc ribbon domain-containing protein [Gammaproteobacteria bacterium]|nr:zinc ribbon domain-containing protein [Gammaproteobacteria bacterium]